MNKYLNKKINKDLDNLRSNDRNPKGQSIFE